MTITDSQLARLDLVRMQLAVAAMNTRRHDITTAELRYIAEALASRCVRAASDLGDLYREIRDQP